MYQGPWKVIPHLPLMKSVSGACSPAGATLYLLIRSTANWSVSAAAGLLTVMVLLSSLMNLASFCQSQPYHTRKDCVLTAAKQTPYWLPSALVIFCVQSRKEALSVGGLVTSSPAALAMSVLMYMPMGCTSSGAPYSFPS